jgi:hypothetical protein
MASSDPSKCVTQFPGVMCAFTSVRKASSLSSAASGFRAVGLWLFGRRVFAENYFVSSGNITTPDDICNVDPCCLVAPQAGDDTRGGGGGGTKRCRKL